MNLGQLKLEVQQVLRDMTIDDVLVGSWLNQIVEELAGEFEIPDLRLTTPAQLAVNSVDWLYPLSATTHPTIAGYAYQKKVTRVASQTVQQGFVLERMEDLDAVDFLHTDHEATVQRVAIEADSVGVYPIPSASDTLYLWCYRAPVPMVAETDIPDGIPAAFHFRVLVPAVVVTRAMRLFPDYPFEAPAANTTALQWWTKRFDAGLYGDGTQIGLVSYWQKQRGVRTRGPRLGENISGGGFWTRRWR